MMKKANGPAPSPARAEAAAIANRKMQNLNRGCCCMFTDALQKRKGIFKSYYISTGYMAMIGLIATAGAPGRSPY